MHEQIVAIHRNTVIAARANGEICNRDVVSYNPKHIFGSPSHAYCHGPATLARFPGCGKMTLLTSI